MKFQITVHNIENLSFPRYYEALSSEKIITMDWMMENILSEFAAHNEDRALRR